MIRTLAALALALATPVAHAKPASDPILGAWGFKTAAYGPSCVLEGHMTIRPAAQPNRYDCTFTAVERCRDWTVSAKQSCKAERTASGLSIRSAVVQSTGTDYRPDDFTLDAIAPDSMRGTMSSVFKAPVAFTRKVALTS